ncbi:MAG: hypothetical protein AAGA99_26505 [Actinomycetota bacterium]
MSAELSTVDHTHPDGPAVNLTVIGHHDMSRLVLMLMHGNCEQAGLGRKLIDRLKRSPAGRATLGLLNDHGGPNFTGATTKEARRWRAIDQLDELMAERERLRWLVGALLDPWPDNDVEPDVGILQTSRDFVIGLCAAHEKNPGWKHVDIAAMEWPDDEASIRPPDAEPSW